MFFIHLKKNIKPKQTDVGYLMWCQIYVKLSKIYLVISR